MRRALFVAYLLFSVRVCGCRMWYIVCYAGCFVYFGMWCMGRNPPSVVVNIGLVGVRLLLSVV